MGIPQLASSTWPGHVAPRRGFDWNQEWRLLCVQLHYFEQMTTSATIKPVIFLYPRAISILFLSTGGLAAAVACGPLGTICLEFGIRKYCLVPADLLLEHIVLQLNWGLPEPMRLVASAEFFLIQHEINEL